MYTITVEKECGCFRKSGMENNVVFQDKDSALMEAMRLSDEMNETFCQKHEFRVREEGNTLLIGVAERPREGGCCGGGHCG
ncbi:hypothetical protein [Nitratifractor sp.]